MRNDPSSKNSKIFHYHFYSSSWFQTESFQQAFVEYARGQYMQMKKCNGTSRRHFYLVRAASATGKGTTGFSSCVLAFGRVPDFHGACDAK